MKKYKAILDDVGVQPHVLETISLIKGILQDHAMEEVALSFNGGKDCTVLLHLLAAAIALIKPDCVEKPLKGLRTFYVDDPLEFDEVRQFMQDMSAEYGFELVSLQGGFKQALTALLERAPVKYIFMGQRRVDPGMHKLQLMAPSDAGYPPFIRVNAIMDWDYNQVWDFLRRYKLAYCVLYDQGYTSLGNKLNTVRHPALAVPDGSYLPAWRLEDGNTERAGRVAGPSLPPTPSAAASSTAASPTESELSSTAVASSTLSSSAMQDPEAVSEVAAAARIRIEAELDVETNGDQELSGTPRSVRDHLQGQKLSSAL